MKSVRKIFNREIESRCVVILRISPCRYILEQDRPEKAGATAHMFCVAHRDKSG